MTHTLTKAKLAALSVELAKYGVEIKRKPKPRIRGEGSPGRRPAWWHGTNSGKLDKLAPFSTQGVASYMRTYGRHAREYENDGLPAIAPWPFYRDTWGPGDDAAAIAAHYADTPAGWVSRMTPPLLALAYHSNPAASRLYLAKPSGRPFLAKHELASLELERGRGHRPLTGRADPRLEATNLKGEAS